MYEGIIKNTRDICTSICLSVHISGQGRKIFDRYNVNYLQAQFCETMQFPEI